MNLRELAALRAEATAGSAHRHTYGHASLTDIAAEVTRSIGMGDWPSTDASYVHADGDDGEGSSIVFIGNGPKQTDNADYLAAALSITPESWSALADVVEAAREVDRLGTYRTIDPGIIRARATARRKLRAALDRLEKP